MTIINARTVHIDRLLSNVVQNFAGEDQFIANKVAPIVTVMNQHDVIEVVTQEDWFRAENDVRAPGAEANQIEFGVNSLSYYANNYALKAQVTMEARMNADPPMLRLLESGRAKHVTRILMLNWEIRLANQIFTPTNVGTSNTVNSSFTDHQNSSPYNTILQRIDNVYDATAFKPNRLLIGKNAWRHISRNDEIIDKANKTGVTGGAKNATKEQVTALFGMDEVIIGSQFKNTANEGQSLALAQVWADSILAYYSPSAASINDPSFMYSFRWQKPGLPNMNVERHPFDKKTKTEELEIGYYQDERILSKSLGGLLVNVTSSGGSGSIVGNGGIT